MAKLKITAHIKPNTKHSERIETESNGIYTIFTKSPATEGQANTAAAKLLAEYFKVSKSKVHLAHGSTSRHKVFTIDS